MKKYTLYIIGVLLLSSCIHEETMLNGIGQSDIQNNAATQKSLLYGLSDYMVSENSYQSTESYYYWDWGYPCFMHYRDICGEDYPICTDNSYDIWTYKESADGGDGYEEYDYNFYYRLIKNCNNLIASIDTIDAAEESLRYYGQALTFRAMAYLDLARMFEFKPTGFTALDAEATENDIWGLTVPWVDENTTDDDLLNNPRLEYFDMYSRILKDLYTALRFEPTTWETDDKSLPGRQAAYGMLARTWLEIASRLDETEHSDSPLLDGFVDSLKSYKSKYPEAATLLDIEDASGAYQKASDYADSVLSLNTSIMSQTEWHNPTTGFNTATGSWIWRMRIGDKAQLPSQYFSFPSWLCSEATNGMAYTYSAWRCISDKLYSKISDDDWRKTSWIDPADAGKSDAATRTKYNTLLSGYSFSKICSYANLKFRPGQGDTLTSRNWLIGDQPLMRVEEMYFIKAEAQCMLGGATAGLQVIRPLLNARSKNGTWAVSPAMVASKKAFVDELIRQKRIEFWGEGITYFDTKRLNIQVDRRDEQNCPDDYRIAGQLGRYCAGWLNFFIPANETDRNQGCIANPNPNKREYVLR